MFDHDLLREDDPRLCLYTSAVDNVEGAGFLVGRDVGLDPRVRYVDFREITREVLEDPLSDAGCTASSHVLSTGVSGTEQTHNVNSLKQRNSSLMHVLVMENE